VNEMRREGDYEVQWNVQNVASGVYVAALTYDGTTIQSTKVNVAK
jgi:hypothetical protein